MPILRFSLSDIFPKLITLISLILFFMTRTLLLLNQSVILEWTIVQVHLTPLKIMLYLDPTGSIYAIIVIFISANVISFSKSYMKNDQFINRFSILVLLFIISIRMLIFIPHLIVLLLGWDGLGITSFILVIYYQNPKSLAAGIITALTNRIGDVIILVSIALTINQGHWNILNMWESNFISAQAITIIVAACTKRAQIPFCSWLPAAIAAPTPVSALVHSSTLVTAGVFLIIRFHQFLVLTPWFKPTLLLIAILTILIAGIRASTECDIKKIIALSTLSQLGVITSALALGATNLASFHIITHALFKALLFICAGELIILHHHSQELRWIGNLTKQTPVASTCILLANCALCGIPFITGFYSKDLILESIIRRRINFTITSLSLLATGFTIFYSARFRIITLWRPATHQPLSSTTEPSNCTTPILLISLLSICGGAIILWLLPNPIFINPILLQIKLAPLILISLGIIMGALIPYTHCFKSFIMGRPLINHASCSIWFLTQYSSQPELKLSISAGHYFTKLIDHGWLETGSGQGIHIIISKSRTLFLSNSPKSPTHILLLSITTIITFTLISSLC